MAFCVVCRLRERLRGEVRCADGQTGQVCPRLGPPGEAPAARVPERCVPHGLPELGFVHRLCALGLAVLGLQCVVSSLGGGEGPCASLGFEKTPPPVVISWGVAVRPRCPGAPAAAAVSQGLLLPARVAEGWLCAPSQEAGCVPRESGCQSPARALPGGGSRAGLPQGWGQVTCVTYLSRVPRYVLLSAVQAGPLDESRSLEWLFPTSS